MPNIDELADQIGGLNARADELLRVNRQIAEMRDEWRSPSKAHLIGSGRTQSVPGDTSSLFFYNLALARSRDFNEQQAGKAALEAMGSTWARAEDAKATIGDGSSPGVGYLIPNNMVASVVQIATSANPFRRILNVVTGVRGRAVDIPNEGLGPTRATVVAWGATKPEVDFTLPAYTATLYTLARIHDVSNQLLRHSAGAAEQLVRDKLSRAMAAGEAYYILNGSGSSEPKGLLTSFTGAPASFTTTHTASDSTVAGSARRGLAASVEQLASRNYEADAIVMNSGDIAHMSTQGTDTAGFFDEDGVRSVLGLPLIGTTAISSKTALVGAFAQIQLFLGDDFRVDVSSEAGTRWDANITGFRGEEEIGFNADPYVLAGMVQRITTLIP